METYGLDNVALIALGALLFLAFCIALGRSKRATPKEPSIEAELLVQIRNELSENNASLDRLKSAVQHQQATLEKTATTLESMRRSADDHASDLKGSIEKVSGATDAARAEATTRHETMSEAIDTVRTTAADAQEKANDAYLAANGSRRKIDEINGHVAGIPQLRGGMDRLQQGVAAIAANADNIPTLGAGIENLQQSVTAIAEAKPKKGKGRTTAAGRRNNKGGAKADPEGTPANAAAQPSDAGKPAEATPQSEAAPRRESRAAAAPATDSSEPGKPGGGTAAGDSAPSGQQTGPASETPAPSNGESPETAGNDTPAQSGDKTGQAPPASAGSSGTEQQTQAAQ